MNIFGIVTCEIARVDQWQTYGEKNTHLKSDKNSLSNKFNNFF